MNSALRDRKGPWQPLYDLDYASTQAQVPKLKLGVWILQGFTLDLLPPKGLS